MNQCKKPGEVNKGQLDAELTGASDTVRRKVGAKRQRKREPERLRDRD
jgi:hypothetical protein